MIPHKEVDSQAADPTDAWEEVFLEDLIEDAIGGAWGDEPAKARDDQVIVRVIRGTEFRNWEREKGSTAATRAIDPKSFSRRMLMVGDMVVEISGGGPSQPVGRTLVMDQEALDNLGGTAISSNFCRRVRFKPNVNPFFVDRALKLKYSLGELDQFQTETTNIRNLTFPKFISETSIPLPTREVQDQLVLMIEGLQAQAGQARDRLATIPALLKKFRQSVLAAAWQEAAEEGQIKDLLEICESLTDGDHQPPPKSASGIPFITISALEGAVLNIGAAKRFVPNSYLESLDSKRRAKSGDVLYSVTGSIGVPALVETDEPFVFQRHIAILRPNQSKVSSKYMYYLLLSEQALNQGRDCATGIAQMTIPLRGLRKYQVPVPSHAMQSEIVCRVESLFALADSIESRLGEATAQVERTTQAILAKAFRGELT